jgi:hypothetical protein
MDYGLVDPTEQPAALAVALAERPVELRGLRLGLMENSKPNAAALLEEVEHFLRGELQPVVVNRYSVPGTLPAPDDTLDQIAAECDLVIEAIGD